MPRLNLPDKYKRYAESLFYNYTKRNSIQGYLQSYGAIGSRIINTVMNARIDQSFTKKIYGAKFLDSEFERNEYIFWLYTTVREELLPINYYNLMIESALVMGGVFTFLFSKLDPEMF